MRLLIFQGGAADKDPLKARLALGSVVASALLLCHEVWGNMIETYPDGVMRGGKVLPSIIAPASREALTASMELLRGSSGPKGF